MVNHRKHNKTNGLMPNKSLQWTRAAVDYIADRRLKAVGYEIDSSVENAGPLAPLNSGVRPLNAKVQRFEEIPRLPILAVPAG